MCADMQVCKPDTDMDTDMGRSGDQGLMAAFRVTRKMFFR